MPGRGCVELIVAGALLFAAPTPPSRGQVQVIDREYEIKAAYLYNFGLYVQWPRGSVPTEQEEFVIGVLGKDVFDSNLDKLATAKKVQGRKIVIHRFKSMADYKPCHILFISRSAAEGNKESPEDRLAEAMQKLKNKPVLLVAESNGLAMKGAMINLFVEENRVKFEVNPGAGKQAGLQMSSKLLQLGKVVPKE